MPPSPPFSSPRPLGHRLGPASCPAAQKGCGRSVRPFHSLRPPSRGGRAFGVHPQTHAGASGDGQQRGEPGDLGAGATWPRGCACCGAGNSPDGKVGTYTRSGLGETGMPSEGPRLHLLPSQPLPQVSSLLPGRPWAPSSPPSTSWAPPPTATPPHAVLSRAPPPASHGRVGLICLVPRPCQQAGPTRPPTPCPHTQPPSAGWVRDCRQRRHTARGSSGAVSRSQSSCGFSFSLRIHYSPRNDSI